MSASRLRPPVGKTGSAPFPRGEGAHTPAIPGINWKRTAVISFSMLCFTAAIVIAAYPFLADRANAYEAARSFTEQRDELASMPQDEAREATAAAEAYNDMLAGRPGAESALPYEEQLAGARDGSMCWIEIPRIGVKEPVYRGGSEDELYAALMEGAAHVRGSSLPVGGASSNTVITGHSGMRNSSMFDHLDLLQPGDAIILWTMGAPYAYEVVDAELVEPERTDVMRIVNGLDQCTLITCRNPSSTSGFLPGGTFTHRLVVHSERADWSPSLAPQPHEHVADGRSTLFGASLVGTGVLIWAASSLALGFRRNWVLDRIVGAHELSPEEVSRIERERGIARLRLGMLGSARLDLFGKRAKGRWSRVKPDSSRMRLRFRLRKPGAFRLEGEPGVDGLHLQQGDFIARGLDGELGIGADKYATMLVFRPERATRRRDRIFGKEGKEAAPCLRRNDARACAKRQRP